MLFAAPLALKGIALAGALYLRWLGYRNLRAGVSPAFAAAGGAVTAASVCRDAILTNLLPR